MSKKTRMKKAKQTKSNSISKPRFIQPAKVKKSYWLLKSYIYLLLLLNGFVILLSIFAMGLQQKYHAPHVSFLHLELTAAVRIFNIFFLLLILKWKKIGLYGFCISMVIMVTFNYYIVDMSLLKAIMPLILVVLLIIFLKLGGKSSAWHTMT